MGTPTSASGRLDAVSRFSSLSYVQAGLATAAVMGGIVARVLVAFALFLQTELGLALRATGVNAPDGPQPGVTTAGDGAQPGGRQRLAGSAPH